MSGELNKAAGKEKAGTLARTPADKALQAFAELIIKKMDSLAADWQKPWINTKVNGGPQNLEGRRYSGLNTLFLFLVSEMAGYEMPVFMTFLQAKKNGLLINKGEKAFPVIYFNFLVKDNETGKKISIEEWEKLPKETQKKYTVIPFMKTHPVFNIEQSNIKEARPELWESIRSKFIRDIPLDTTGMISCPEMDLLLDAQGWACPIYTEEGDRAFYSVGKDEIHVPLKAQFNNGEAFYGTLAHEMAHSTGSNGRLARNFDGRSLQAYGREELVAELTSAVVMASLGVSITPSQENVSYLKGWCQNIHKDPQFLLTTLSDVSKASGMILEITDKYRLILDERKKKEHELENVKKQTYAPAEGHQLEFQFTELPASESHESLTGKLLQREVPSLAPGDFCMVQRVFDVSRHFEFTSGMTVNTPQDVAYIFKNLEDASIENAFAVLVKDQIPVVLHLGMGHFHEVNPVSSPIKTAFDRIAADQVYFIHNHPSGVLKASTQDLKYWEQLKRVFEDKLMPGIIINLKSGKYGLFSPEGQFTEMEKRNVEEEIPLRTLSFSKQVFSPSYDAEENFVIRSSEDVASFISSHRLGDREKISALILNRRAGVVANVLTPYTQINEKNTNAMAQYLAHTITVAGGATAILYGDFTMNAWLKVLAKEVERYSFGDFRVTDAVAIKGNHSNHISALNECYLNEEKIAYVKRENEKASARQAEKETDAVNFDEVKAPSEEEIIINQAKAKGTYMKAPNGKPTNLDERQWVQVRTKAFKKWFGDWENDPKNASKIVDNNGEPKVLYHFSPEKDITIFNIIRRLKADQIQFQKDIISSLREKRGQKGTKLIGTNVAGVWFTEDKGYESYGENKYACFLDIKNPAVGDSIFYRRSSSLTYDREKGVDGYIANHKDHYYYGEVSVTLPEQIKSATHNTGEFSLSNDDIHYRSIVDEKKEVNLGQDEEAAAKKRLECAINNLSKMLNTPVTIIHHIHDITDGDKKIQTDKRSAKGWFDPNTDEVVIVLPNIVSIRDMQATLLHEIVAHKGLQGLLGDKLGDMMDSIYQNLPSHVKNEVLDSAIQNHRGNTRLATEEYLATVAENGVTNPGLWINVQASIKQFFRSLGIDLMVTEKDIMSLLWKSKKHLEEQSTIFSMKTEKDSARQAEKEVGEFSLENGNYARQINNSRMEQEFQKVDVSKINWEQLNAKFGVSKEMLEEKGVLEDMLCRKKSNRLLNVKYETASGQKEFEARVAFREKEGGISLQFYPVRQTPPLDQPYHGYTFTEEDKRTLQQTGHLGKVIEIQPYNKDKEQVYISLDPLTNDIVHLRKDRIKLKDEVGHVALSDQQKSELLEGRPVYIKDMTNREGKKFSAFVQIDADKKALAFLPASKVLIEHIPEISGVPLSEEQKKILKEGGSLSLNGLQSKDGRSFSANVSYNSEERKFNLDFPEAKKINFTEEQKAALAAGEKILLTGLISKNGKPYDMIVYQDKETGKIEKEWPVKDTAFKVKLSQDQQRELQNGGYVWIEGLQKKDGTTFKAPVIWNAKKGFFEFAQVAKKEQQTEKDKSQAANQAREEAPRRGQRL